MGILRAAPGRKPQPTVLELISEARKLADDMGVEVCGLAAGDKVEGMAKVAGRIRC